MPQAALHYESSSATVVKSLMIACCHCGDALGDERVTQEEKHFCCKGCATVFSLIHQNGLGNFYQIGGAVAPKGNEVLKDFTYLDDEKTLHELAEFVDETRVRVRFVVPAIHCASCLWLLERLSQLYPPLIHARVDLVARTFTVVLDRTTGQLSEVAQWMLQLGYEPDLNLDDLRSDEIPQSRQLDRLLVKLGVAGFAAGNVMLLAFPEYLGMSAGEVHTWRPIFGALSVFLALPVLAFSASTYFKGAYAAIVNRQVSVDLPIALGMLAMLGQSAFEIATGTGPGYLDSLLGLVFFLLVGRWFQRQTHKRLRFDRDYRSYLPLAASVEQAGTVVARRIDELRPGNVVYLNNGELLPADGILQSSSARFDRSFLTGESDPIRVQKGGIVYAGSRSVGAVVSVLLTQKVDGSYLARLWSEGDLNHEQKEASTNALLKKIGQGFTAITLMAAAVTFLYWSFIDVNTAFRASTAVLIVACPCAASLAIPFVYGRLTAAVNSLGLALRNTDVVDRFADVKAAAFDKTGTLTKREGALVQLHGTLHARDRMLLCALIAKNTHPVAQAVFSSICEEFNIEPLNLFEDSVEYPGLGLQGKIDGKEIRFGRPDWALAKGEIFPNDAKASTVVYSIDGALICSFTILNAPREEAFELIAFAKTAYEAHLISGDSEREASFWAPHFGNEYCAFRQNPTNKLERLKTIQRNGKEVLYIGDGLNDAGALQVAHVGISITEEHGGFNPACDGILLAEKFGNFKPIWRLLSKGRTLVYGALALAVLYNLVGLYFAVTAQLAPVVAAILMPLSSVSVILYAWISVAITKWSTLEK